MTIHPDDCRCGRCFNTHMNELITDIVRRMPLAPKPPYTEPEYISAPSTLTLDLIDKQLDMSHLEDLTEEQAIALAWTFDPNEPPPGVMHISSYAADEPEYVSVSHWGLFEA